MSDPVENQPEAELPVNPQEAETPNPGGEVEAETTVVEIDKAELEELRTKVQSLSKKQRQAEAEAKRQQEAQLAEQGKFKELAEQREAEAKAAKEELAATKRLRQIEKVASRHGFHRPEDVSLYIPADVNFESDTDLENAVLALKEERPYLISKGPLRTGGDAGNTTSSGLSIAAIRAMSPEELSKLDQEEVAAALRASMS